MRSLMAKRAGAYACLVLAAVLLAFNYQLFIVKNGFAPAGINGIATMVQYKTGFSIAYMSLLINVPLCVFAYFCVDRAFAAKSLCFCLVYAGAYLLVQRWGLEAFQYDAQGHDTIFPVILSGILSGVVYGTCFRLNASTGGTDILSRYIAKHRPALNFFWVTFALNAVVAAASFFVYAKPDGSGELVYDYKPVCLCVMYCFISSYMGSTIIRGTKSAYKFTVITDHADEICAELLHDLHHGATRIVGTGAYSSGEKEIVLCVVNRHQLVDFQNILKKYENTFAFSESVNETYGNFVHIK